MPAAPIDIDTEGREAASSVWSFWYCYSPLFSPISGHGSSPEYSRWWSRQLSWACCAGPWPAIRLWGRSSHTRLTSSNSRPSNHTNPTNPMESRSHRQKNNPAVTHSTRSLQCNIHKRCRRWNNRLVRRERRRSRNIPANDQRLDCIRSLVGKDGLDIGVVTRDMIVQQNAIAAQHLAGLRDNFARQPCIVHLRQRGHRIRHLALLLQLAEAQAQQLHAGDVGKHRGQLGLDDLEIVERASKLHALPRIVPRDFVGGHCMTYGLPGNTGTGSSQHPRGIFEATRIGQPIFGGHTHVCERDIGLPDGPLGHLAGHDLWFEARSAFFDQEASHLALVIARPDDGDIGKRGVANPTFGAIDDVFVAITPRARFEHHGVGAVIRLGQAKSADLLHTRHERQPALLLLF